MKIRDLIFPPRCICCSLYLDKDNTASPFCKSCQAKWEHAKNRCTARCAGQPFFVFESELYAKGKGGYVLHLADYTPNQRYNTVNRFIFELKNHASKRTVSTAASELAAMIKRELPLVTKGGGCYDSTVVAWIPRSFLHVLLYGFDHAGRVAKTLAFKLELPAERLIGRRIVSSAQKRLAAKKRRLNAQHSLKLSVSGDAVMGKTVLLIDDIVTSGASLEAATRLLLNAGASQVISVTLTRTYSPRDDDFNLIKNDSDSSAAYR